LIMGVLFNSQFATHAKQIANDPGNIIN
jgi:hypothetical protein